MSKTSEEHDDWVYVTQHLVEDLDRCEHGRHSIDNCWSCSGGWSLGNPRAHGEDRRTPDGESILAYTLYGGAYVLTSPQPGKNLRDVPPLVRIVNRGE